MNNHVFQVGQRIEIFDRDPSMKKWLPGCVVELREGEVKVHFDGFAAKFDEWLPVDSIHISPFGQHTKRKCLYQLRGPVPVASLRCIVPRSVALCFW
jgi:hypothetical protein